MNTALDIFVVSLGCAKNLVDSETMMGLLNAAGYRIVSRLEEARVVVVNTCGFIQEAVEETIETILEMVQRKEQGWIDRIIVVGCFVQRYGYKLAREIPEVDGWAGTEGFQRITELLSDDPFRSRTPFIIGPPAFPVDDGAPRLLSGTGFSAYLKIADGCGHRCSFCMIPVLRGPLRSRSVQSLVDEAGELAAGGVVELNLVAQDTTTFGADRTGESLLEDLLEALLAVDGLRWVRLLYAHPYGVTDRLLSLMEKEERICPYLDIPFQHVNPAILEAMQRMGARRERPLDMVRRIRALKRDIRIRTTLMVGFPGETPEAFEELCAFVADADLDYMGAFVFSPEKGIPACNLPAPVPFDVAKRRFDRLMRIQSGVSLRRRQAMVGRVEPVLVEGLCPETDLLLVGRTAGMAPDVDGRILINRGHAHVGSIVPVRLTEAHPYDLVGEIIGPPRDGDSFGTDKAGARIPGEFCFDNPD